MVCGVHCEAGALHGVVLASSALAFSCWAWLHPFLLCFVRVYLSYDCMCVCVGDMVGWALAEHLVAVSRAFKGALKDKVTVVCEGSVWKSWPLFQDTFSAIVREKISTTSWCVHVSDFLYLVCVVCVCVCVCFFVQGRRPCSG